MLIRRRYPPELDAVLEHARRLQDFIGRKERAIYIFDPGGPWIAGRAGEIQCVVALVAMDWHEGRHDTEAAVASLNRYLRGLHDGLAMYLDIEQPPCCRPLPKEEHRAGADPRHPSSNGGPRGTPRGGRLHRRRPPEDRPTPKSDARRDRRPPTDPPPKQRVTVSLGDLLR
jgi:hypothetical protein